MRYNYKNNVRLEGWSAADARFDSDGKVAHLLLAIQVWVPDKTGATVETKELIELEMTKKLLRFIPLISKGTHLLIDAMLRTENGRVIVSATRVISTDWEGFKSEGLKTLANGMTIEQDEQITHWIKPHLRADVS